MSGFVILAHALASLCFGLKSLFISVAGRSILYERFSTSSQRHGASWLGCQVWELAATLLLADVLTCKKSVTVNSCAQVVGTFWQFSPTLDFLFTTHLNGKNLKIYIIYVKEPCISQRVFVQSILKAPIPQRTVHLQYHPEYPAKNKKNLNHCHEIMYFLKILVHLKHVVKQSFETLLQQKQTTTTSNFKDSDNRLYGR